MSEESIALIQATGATLEIVNLSDAPLNLAAGSAFPELGNGIWLRLHLWTLTQYQALLSIDADALLLKNVDEMFHVQHFASGPAYFPGGLLVVLPSMDIYAAMINLLRTGGSRYVYGEQDFMNFFWRKRERAVLHGYELCWADRIGHSQSLKDCRYVDFASCNANKWKPWDTVMELGSQKICRNLPSDEFWVLQRHFLNLYHRAMGYAVTDLWQEPTHAWVDGERRLRLRLMLNNNLLELVVAADEPLQRFLAKFCSHHHLGREPCKVLERHLHIARRRPMTGGIP